MPSRRAQQGVAADRHGKPACQAGADLTAGMQSDAALRLGKANGPTNPRQWPPPAGVRRRLGAHLGE